MEFIGQLEDVNIDFSKGTVITFTTKSTNANTLNEYLKLKDKELKVSFSQKKNKRSLDANACLWFCLNRIAVALNTDKWLIYLQMLKRYGKFTYICVKPNVVDKVKEQWRECEVIGETTINGQKAVQLLCYFGSSTYDTKEFSTLLNGVISEMEEMGLDTPTSEDVRAMIKKLEKERGKNNE